MRPKAESTIDIESEQSSCLSRVLTHFPLNNDCNYFSTV